MDWQPVLVFHYLPSKNIYSHVSVEFPVFQFAPIVFFFSLSSAQESDSVFFTATHQVFISTSKISLNLFFPRLNRARYLSLSLYSRLLQNLNNFCCLSLTFFSRSMTFLYWGTQSFIQYRSILSLLSLNLPGGRSLSLPQGHISGSWSSSGPGSPRSFLTRCSLAS